MTMAAGSFDPGRAGKLNVVTLDYRLCLVGQWRA